MMHVSLAAIQQPAKTRLFEWSFRGQVRAALECPSMNPQDTSPVSEGEHASFLKMRGGAWWYHSSGVGGRRMRIPGRKPAALATCGVHERQGGIWIAVYINKQITSAFLPEIASRLTAASFMPPARIVRPHRRGFYFRVGRILRHAIPLSGALENCAKIRCSKLAATRAIVNTVGGTITSNASSYARCCRCTQ